MNLLQVYEGWRNYLFPPEELKKQIDRVAKERMKICSSCSYNSKFHKTIRPDEHCTECGCPLVAKVRCLSCKCGVDKWQAELTEDQEEEINKILEDGKI